MGMCQERTHYHIEIMKEVPGTNNFVTAVKLPGSYNNPNVKILEQVTTLNQVCNGDKNARIKFAVISS